MPVHKTLADPDGNTYKVVPSWWLNTVLGLVIFGIVVLMLIIAIVIDNRRAVDEAYQFSNKMGDRNKASQDLGVQRTRVSQWNYEHICAIVKDSGKPCLENPQWWLDPEKYPSLANDPSGVGLFHKEQ